MQFLFRYSRMFLFIYFCFIIFYCVFLNKRKNIEFQNLVQEWNSNFLLADFKSNDKYYHGSV